MDKKSLSGSIMLLICALCFGCCYVVQSISNKILGPFTVNCIRFITGGILLIPVMFVFDRINIKHGATKQEIRSKKKQSLLGGFICGLSLTLASSLQQTGLIFTTAGNAGFIVSLYIIFVPIIGLIFGKKVGLNVWLAIVLAVGGLFLISFSLPFKFNLGDILSICSAIGFAINIILIGKFSAKCDGIFMSIIQMLTTGVFCGILAPIFGEKPTATNLVSALPYVVISAVLVCCVAYTLQVIGQKYTPPSIASVIISLESVFAFIAGIIFLKEPVTPMKIGGALLVMCAVLLAQFNPFNLIKKKKLPKEKNSGVEE